MKKDQEDQYDPFEEAGPVADDLAEPDEPVSAHAKKKRRAQREKQLGLSVLGLLVLVLLGAVGYRLFTARRALPPAGSDAPPSVTAAQQNPAPTPPPALPAPPATFKTPEKAETTSAQKPPITTSAVVAPPTLMPPSLNTPPALPSTSIAAAAAKPALETPPTPPPADPPAPPAPPPMPQLTAAASQPPAPPPQSAPALLNMSSSPPPASPTVDAAPPIRYSQRYEPQGAGPSVTHSPGEPATVTGQWRYGQTAPASGTSSPPGSSAVRMTAVSSESYAPANPLPRRSSEAGVRPDGTYKVQPNDNYWTISERLYGTGAYFKALAEVNRQNNPQVDRLEVGAMLIAPAAEDLQKKYPELCPKPSHRRAPANRLSSVSMQGNVPGRRVYIVEPGDNLFEIARRELGRADRWAEIYDLNRDKLGDDTNYLAPGTRLTMPDNRETRSSGSRVAERSDDTLRR
jgi:nucleoid-associated protein YgaU